MTGTKAAAGHRVVADIRQRGGKAEFVEMDLREPGAPAELVAATVARLGRLDVLVNNAGILYPGTALDTTDHQWRDIMAVNVDAPFFASRSAVKVMLGQGKGAIVNIASEWGLNGEPNYAPTARARQRSFKLRVAWPWTMLNRTSASMLFAQARSTRGWWTIFLQKKAVTPPAIFGNWPPGSQCVDWQILSRWRVVCVFWPQMTRAT
jgi:NAD(P)-dependent dehydrogenase (short-subunit alcohol dehydrogenase family)